MKMVLYMKIWLDKQPLTCYRWILHSSPFSLPGAGKVLGPANKQKDSSIHGLLQLMNTLGADETSSHLATIETTSEPINEEQSSFIWILKKIILQM
jgi:hypothetical protein